MNRVTLPRVLISAVLTILLGNSMFVLADDTEIYLNSASGGGPANVLFNLDTSGSMSSKVDENNNGSIDSGERTRIEVLKEAMHTVLDSLPPLNAGIMRYHYHGGPILYPVAPLNAEACIIEGTCSSGSSTTGSQTLSNSLSGNNDATEETGGIVTLNGSSLSFGYRPGGGSCTDVTESVRVSSGNDDAEERVSDGNMYQESSDLELPRDGSTQQIIGLRFRNVSIPAAATVTDARIEFEIDKVPSGYNDPIDLLIQGESATGARNELSDSNAKLSARPKTIAIVDWETAEFPGINSKLTTPNISSILQEVVNDAAWASGQDMVLLVMKDPSGSDNGSRETESYNGESGAAPLLTYTYQDCASAVATEVRTGLRFTDIGVPQGATITGARLDFIATSADGGTPSFRVKVENSDDAPAFSSGTAFSTRSFVLTSVPWDASSTPVLDDPWVVDTTYSAPDLTAQVQQVVNRSGWCGGNAMMFMVERDTLGTSGIRSAYSSEGSSTQAPKLTITYDADNPQPSATGCVRSTIVRSVTAGNNDAEEHADGTMDLGSSDLEMVQESDTQIIGVRFSDIAIAQGATISSAKLVFRVDELHSGTTSLTFKGQLSENASAFSTSTNNISDTSARPRTTASVNWSPPAFSVAGASVELTGLETIVQEIVNQGGWTPGNSLALIISGSGKRVAVSFDGDPAKAPRLEITFEGTPVTAKKTVRSRLKDIVSELTQRSGTPILGSMVEAAYYFRGEPVHFGLQRGTKSSSDKVTRVSHAASYQANGSTVTYPGSCSDANLNHTDCKDQVISGGSPRYKSPIIAECQSNYLINLTDGGGYFTSDEKTRTNSFTGKDANGSTVSLTNCDTDTTLPDGSSYSGSEHNECTVKLAKFLHEADQIYTSSQGLQSGTAPIDGVQTLDIYTIGFNLCGSGNVSSLSSAGEQVCCSVSNHNTTTGICSSPITDPDRIKVLKAQAAVAGGEYYNANTAGELVAAFANITSNIVQKSTSFAAPSIAANAFNRLFSRDEVLVGLFEPSKKGRWDGNLKKYGICVVEDPDGDGNDDCTLGDILDSAGATAIVNNPGAADDGLFSDAAQSFWSNQVDGRETKSGGAGGEITDYTERKIYTEYTTSGGQAASGTALSTSGHEITSSNWSASAVSAVRDQVCPTPDTSSGSDCENRMLWMLGKDVKDEDNDNSTNTRWWFNDVLHSSPAVVTYGKDSSDNPIDKILVATNEGGLHFINNSTGKEEWSFMPHTILAKQPSLFDDSAPSHVYGLDSSPIVKVNDVNHDGVIDPATDSVHVVIGQRRGGNNIYALDVTPSAIITTNSTTIVPKFLWRISSGSTGFGRLGDTWSEPKYATINTVSGAKSVIIFGGGYDSDLDLDDGSGLARNFGLEGGDPNTGNAIYIVDAATGGLIFSISSDSGADIVVPEMKYAIPSNVTVFDSDSDEYDDRIYVGDTAGQIWRVDLKDVDPSGTSPEGNSVVGRLANISTAGTLASERRFFYRPSVVQLVDTTYSDAANGKYDYIMIGSGNRSNPLDTSVQDRFYAFRDYHIAAMTDNDSDNIADGYPLKVDGTAKGSPITGASGELTDVTLAVMDSSNTTHTAGYGWYFDFNTVGRSGEKVLSPADVIAGKLIFTTYIPDDPSVVADVCTAAEGTSRVYNFNVISAAAAIDWDGDGTLEDIVDRSSSLGGGISTQVIPVFTSEGVVSVAGTGGGLVSIDLDTQLPRFRTYWYQDNN